MEILFNAFLKIFVNTDNIHSPQSRVKIANIEGFSSIIINILIFVIKLVIGIMLNSIALIADSIHTLSDILSSIVIILGFRFANKPEDEEHPFGHQRIESITGIIVAVLLIATGFEFIKSSIERIINPQISSSSLIFIILIIITILLKEFLAQFALFLGNLINSPALKADFYHHRIDALSSIFVIIALIFAKYNLPAIDGYMGIIVSIMIIYSGIAILKESSEDLIGKPPEKEILDKISSIVFSYNKNGVKGMHDAILNYYGKKIIGSIHVELDDTLSLIDAHTISEQIEDDIMEQTGIYITVHIDPININNPLLNEISEKLKKIISNIEDIDSIHDIRLIGDNNRFNIAFDVSIKKTIKKNRKNKIHTYILEILKEDYPHLHAITIKFEPLFSY